MSNQYFEHENKLKPGTKARAEEVNARFDNIVLGFEKLPAPHPTEKGFVDPVAVGTPTNTDHAVSAGQSMGGGLDYAIDSGTANAYVVNLVIAPVSYRDGLKISFKAANANTGASTINVNGLGVKQIVRTNGQALAPGDIGIGQIVSVIFNGNQFYGSAAFQGQFNELIAENQGYAAQAAVSAGTATTQAGIATTKANEATTQAGIATTKANEATTQVGIATTKAGEAAGSATAAAADRVQTGLDKTATAADRTQTGLDKAATAADRTQTGLDKAATAADRIQTGLDKTATAADRVQTGQDKTAAANSASTATTQAGIATTKAGETATSATNSANSAMAAEQSHQNTLAIFGDAQAIQDAVNASTANAQATASDKAATAAYRVATGEDKAATAADRAQTGQDKTATAADRVQTGLDRDTVAQSVLDAAASATNANSSAVFATSEADRAGIEADAAEAFAVQAGNIGTNKWFLGGSAGISTMTLDCAQYDTFWLQGLNQSVALTLSNMLPGKTITIFKYLGATGLTQQVWLIG